jgi:hypothetical protein
MRFVDLTGKRFGRLLVIQRVFTGKPPTFWLCRCDCGTEKQVRYFDLKSGHTSSCGCYRRDFPVIQKTKHGHANARGCSSTYSSWLNMKNRCDNQQGQDYHHYGGRGIAYEPRWADFENFLADMGVKPKGLTLERVDNSRGYSKENCKWATRKDQSRNRRDNVRLTYKGETRVIGEWSEILGISKSAIRSRLAYGWSVEEALSVPVQPYQKYKKRTH